MSAKFLKALAAGSCRVRNVRSGEVRYYWDGAKRRDHGNIPPHTTIDIIAENPPEMTTTQWIAALRKSRSLKDLFYEGHLQVVD